MGAVVLGILLLVGLWWFLRRKRRLVRAAVPRRRLQQPSAGIPSHLMRELDRLTRDHRVSLRLIERIEFSNPGRSKRWCVEKAIYDIQRDRRS